MVAGAPEEVADHAEKIAEMGLGMVDTMPTLVDPSTNAHLKIRVGKILHRKKSSFLVSLMNIAGVNSGVVVAGVVGLKMPRYCLYDYHSTSTSLDKRYINILTARFGDAVNTAAKMEATSEARRGLWHCEVGEILKFCLQSMRIQITETTLKHLQENPRYDIVHRGIVDIKVGHVAEWCFVVG